MVPEPAAIDAAPAVPAADDDVFRTTVDLPRDLWDRFGVAAKANHRSRIGELRAFMERFADEHESKVTGHAQVIGAQHRDLNSRAA